MIKTINYLYCIFFISVICLSCTKKKGSIEKDLSFDSVVSIAKDNNTPFCVVLADSTQNLSKNYIESINNEYSYITEKATFNIVDISSEKSVEFIQWLLPKTLPLTCVFSSSGELIDLIPGVAKENFLYIDKAIETKKTREYHWPNSFQRNKSTMVNLLGQLMNFNQEVSSGKYEWKDYRYLSDSLNYPYIDYLLIKAAAQQKDSTFIKQIAQKLSNFETSKYIGLFKDEFIEVRKIINPNFGIENVPNIRTNKEKIELANLKVGKSTPLEIIIYNDGEELLRIDKINMSCTCVRFEGDDEGIIIEGKKSYKA